MGRETHAYVPSPRLTPRILFPSWQGGNWTQLPFNLTPSAATTCRRFPADTPPLWCKLGAHSGRGDDGHACIQCSGELAISLETAGASVDLDYAFFQPGEWGRYKGLPLNKDSVTWLQRGGYSVIRTGGTYVEADSDEVPTDPEDTGRNGFLWKKQRGPPWLRPVQHYYDLGLIFFKLPP